MAVYAKEPLSIRVTRDNFAEFCDSLVIPEESQKIKLSPVFFDNLSLLTGDYQYDEIFSALNDKFKPDILKTIRQKQAEEEESQVSQADNPSAIYSVNLSQQRQNERVINLNKSSGMGINPSMYSMVSIDDKNTELNFEKDVEKTKYAVSQNDFSGAEEILNNLRQKSAANNKQLFILAGLYEKINKPDEACAIYKKISEAEPGKIEYSYNYAVCLYKNNYTDLAEKTFLRVVK